MIFFKPTPATRRPRILCWLLLGLKLGSEAVMMLCKAPKEPLASRPLTPTVCSWFAELQPGEPSCRSLSALDKLLFRGLARALSLAQWAPHGLGRAHSLISLGSLSTCPLLSEADPDHPI